MKHGFDGPVVMEIEPTRLSGYAKEVQGLLATSGGPLPLFGSLWKSLVSMNLTVEIDWFKL